MTVSVPLNVLLKTMEEQEQDFSKKEILFTTLATLKAMEEYIAWTYLLIKHYTEHHEEGLNLVPFMPKQQSLLKVEKFVRNKQYKEALEKSFPWLLYSPVTSEKGIAGFDKVFKIAEALDSEFRNLYPERLKTLEVPEEGVSEE